MVSPRSSARLSWLVWASLLTLLAMTSIAALGGNGIGPAFTLDSIAAEAGGAVAALAMLVVFYGDSIDLSIGGLYSLSIVLIGAGDSVGWSHLFAALGAVVALSLVRGLLAFRIQATLLVGLLIGLLAHGLALFVSGGTSLLTPPGSNALLSFLDSETLHVPNRILALLVICGAVAATLNRSEMGRRLRAAGISADRAELVGIATLPIQLLAHLMGGIVLFCGVVLAFSRAGVASPTSGDPILAHALVAFIVANGGLVRWTPSAFRVIGASLLLNELDRRLTLLEFPQYWFETLAAGLALCVLAISTLATQEQRHGG